MRQVFADFNRDLKDKTVMVAVLEREANDHTSTPTLIHLMLTKHNEYGGEVPVYERWIARDGWHTSLAIREAIKLLDAVTDDVTAWGNGPACND